MTDAYSRWYERHSPPHRPLAAQYTSADPIRYNGSLVYPMYSEEFGTPAVRIGMTALSAAPPAGLRGWGIGLSVLDGYVRFDGRRLGGIDVWGDALAAGLTVDLAGNSPGALFTLTPVWVDRDGVQKSWEGNYGILVEHLPDGRVTLWCSVGEGPANFANLVVEIATEAIDPAEPDVRRQEQDAQLLDDQYVTLPFRYRVAPPDSGRFVVDTFVEEGAYSPEGAALAPRATAPAREPERTAAPGREPEQAAAPAREPEQAAAPAREPEQAAAPVREPEQAAAPIREPERTVAREPERTVAPAREPERTVAPPEPASAAPGGAASPFGAALPEVPRGVPPERQAAAPLPARPETPRDTPPGPRADAPGDARARAEAEGRWASPFGAPASRDPGYRAALYDLGVAMFERGDQASARGLWTQAAEAGHPVAAYYLGVLLLNHGDREGAESWWRAAAERGEPRAAAEIAKLERWRNRAR